MSVEGDPDYGEEAEVRVGDRYLHADIRITITHVDTDPTRIRYSAMNPDTKAVWESRVGEIPSSWVFVGSEPVPALSCLGCHQDEAEPGTIYCFDCAVIYADSWAGVHKEDAKRMVRLMIDDDEKERARK
jgi:hypothetical protein